MVCSHLQPLERALAAAGVPETFRGKAWSKNCREWVYFDVVLTLASIRPHLPPHVDTHENLDPRSGTERGFVCGLCGDAIMGRIDGAPTFAMPPP
jgi:hypothetical protein